MWHELSYVRYDSCDPCAMTHVTYVMTHLVSNSDPFNFQSFGFGYRSPRSVDCNTCILLWWVGSGMCQIQRHDKQAGKDFTDITPYIFYFDLTWEITVQDFSESWGLVSRLVTMTHGPMWCIWSDSRKWITVQQLLVLRCQQLCRVLGHKKTQKEGGLEWLVLRQSLYIHLSYAYEYIHTYIYLLLFWQPPSAASFRGSNEILKEASSFSRRPHLQIQSCSIFGFSLHMCGYCIGIG